MDIELYPERSFDLYSLNLSVNGNFTSGSGKKLSFYGQKNMIRLSINVVRHHSMFSF